MALKKKLAFHLKTGKLHSRLGIASSKKIPEADKEKAAHSDNPTERKEGQFALNAEKFKH